MLVTERDTRDFHQRGALPNFTPQQFPALRDFRARFGEAWASARYEDLSLSRRFALREVYEDYIDAIEAVTGQRLENPEAARGHSQVPNPRVETTSRFKGQEARVAAFEEQVAALKEEHPTLELRRREDLMKTLAEEADARRARLAEGLDVGWAGLGRFTGEAGALITDPVNLAAMLVGFPGLAGAAGASLAARLGRIALGEATLGAASEAAIQTAVYPFKQEIGSPYTPGDAVQNVAMAGGGGAVLGAGAELVSTGFRALLTRWRQARAAGRVPENPQTRAAETILQDAVETAEQSPFPAGVDFDVAHARALDEATAAALYGAPYEGRPLETLQRRQREDIRGLVARTLGIAPTPSEGAPDRIRYAKLTPQQAELLAPHVLPQLPRQDNLFAQAVRLIDAEGVRHALNRHQAGHHPPRPEDFEKIPEVTQEGEFLRVEVKRGKVGVIHRKRYGDRWLNVVEEVRGRKNITLRMLTAYWSDAPKSARGAYVRFSGPNPPGGRGRHAPRESDAKNEGDDPASSGASGTASSESGKRSGKEWVESLGKAPAQGTLEQALSSGESEALARDAQALSPGESGVFKGPTGEESAGAAMMARDVDRLLAEAEARGEEILIPLPGAFDEETGEVLVRPAQELLAEAEDAIELADLLRSCATGGP